ncbi:MAG: GerAB/ArcD/ProY family transporter [Bacteroidetes bacterium]|nr:GerAB/ArcD/ProY family transporter [Bacteroidota bacterium]
MKSLFNPRFATISGMILLAALSRLLPHPPNFAPITAIALFGGAYFSDKRLAFLIPILAMLLSDLIIGFHTTMPFVYGCFALITLIGFRLKENKSAGRIALASVAGSTLFFVITNFAVWALSSSYPYSISGLIACYAAAVPFYDYTPFSSMLLNTFMGDVFFSAVFFGAFAIAEQKIPALIRK